MSFFRTPKGLLLVILTVFIAAAAPGEGWRVVLPGLLTSVAAAAAVDTLILRWRKRRWELPSGAILTAMIVSMVLSPREPWWVVSAAAVVGVAAKYVLRYRVANIFNPAALGIVVTYFIFGTAQNWWGAVPSLPVLALMLLAGAGIFISNRVNKLPLVLSFLFVYFALFTASAFVSRPEHVAEVFRAPDLQAVLYFAFFILSDPPTSPTRPGEQLLAGVFIATTSF